MLILEVLEQVTSQSGDVQRRSFLLALLVLKYRENAPSVD